MSMQCYVDIEASLSCRSCHELPNLFTTYIHHTNLHGVHVLYRTISTTTSRAITSAVKSSQVQSSQLIPTQFKFTSLHIKSCFPLDPQPKVR